MLSFDIIETDVVSEETIDLSIEGKHDGVFPVGQKVTIRTATGDFTAAVDALSVVPEDEDHITEFRLHRLEGVDPINLAGAELLTPPVNTLLRGVMRDVRTSIEDHMDIDVRAPGSNNGGWIPSEPILFPATNTLVLTNREDNKFIVLSVETLKPDPHVVLNLILVDPRQESYDFDAWEEVYLGDGKYSIIWDEAYPEQDIVLTFGYDNRRSVDPDRHWKVQVDPLPSDESRVMPKDLSVAYWLACQTFNAINSRLGIGGLTHPRLDLTKALGQLGDVSGVGISSFVR